MLKQSLFAAPLEPSLSQLAGWIGSVLSSSLASALCVLAVAIFGIRLLYGILDLRTGFQVFLGAFVLLGAPIFAAAMILNAHSSRALAEPPQDQNLDSRVLPPANTDPFSGA